MLDQVTHRLVEGNGRVAEVVAPAEGDGVPPLHAPQRVQPTEGVHLGEVDQDHGDPVGEVVVDRTVPMMDHLALVDGAAQHRVDRRRPGGGERVDEGWGG